MKNNRSKNTFSEKSFFMMLREMIPLYLRYIKCTIGISLDFWIFEVNVVGYVMLFGVIGSFLRIQPEMLGFDSDRVSRVHSSTKIFGKLPQEQWGDSSVALGQNLAKNLWEQKASTLLVSSPFVGITVYIYKCTYKYYI